MAILRSVRWNLIPRANLSKKKFEHVVFKIITINQENKITTAIDNSKPEGWRDPIAGHQSVI